MPYAVACVVNGVVDNVSVWDAVPSVAGMVDITNQPQVTIGWGYAGGVFSPPALTRALLKERAQTELDRVTGVRGTIVRCAVAGVAVPLEWKTYVVALRSIVNGTDTTSTALPVVPPYPVGT